MAETMATRQAYGKTLIELGEKYPQLVVMDADLSKSTMTAEFGKTYPDRFFNMGIAEQNLYGAAAGLAGLCHTIQVRACYPTDLMGGEMLIIAAVVLGGTTISGGRGTVFGTFLGLFLITMIKSSLILIGVPSVWQTFVVGMMIVIGTAVSAYQVLRDKRRLAPVMDPEPEVQKGGIS